MKLVLIPLFISLLDAALAAMLQITLPQSLSVREGENVTIPCSFSPSTSSLSHIVLLWFTMPRHYAENVTSREMKKIYFLGYEKDDLSIVKSVGDVLTGDCSIGIPNFPKNLGPVALCRIDCRRCNAENTEVQGEVLLNVMPAAPRSHGGGVSDVTLTPLEETSHKGGVVAARVLTVVVISAIIIIIVIIIIVVIPVIVVFVRKKKNHRWCSWPCLHSRSDGGCKDVPGDVRRDVKGQPLMNGHEEKRQQVLETVAV
ncbi:uncharacterized protein LOC142905355 [Petromyzon marinus]|uniref:uncharacterized protein LOC142905355 n=1 Tax=Petromyzon marinus TaxID=7757 RepID=UPI003F71CEA9